MNEVYEWSLAGGGALQLFEDSKRAGSSSVTFSVSGIDKHVATLEARGIEICDRTMSDMASTAIIQDPDGNRVVLAEQRSSSLAR